MQRRFPPQKPVGAGAQPLQRATAARGLAGRQHIVRPPGPDGARAEELVAQPGGRFAVVSGQRQTLQPPSGTFNFVRVHGEVPRSQPLFVSARLPHAQIAGGRPVVYAGTVHFDRGEMAWWSNYSGTYQPIAEFRAQAGLPNDKFVPWQRLALGGVAMQRGAFQERRAAAPPEPGGAGRDAAAARSTAPATSDRAAPRPAPRPDGKDAGD